MWRRAMILICLVAVPGMASRVSAGLVGYWPLDEATGGKVLDASGKSHDGTINGATRATPGWNGQGACLLFNGSNARVEVPDAADLRFSATARYTLAAWVNWTTLPGHWSGIVTKGREVGNWYGIWLDPTNRWVFGHGGNNQIGSAALANVWIHVAMVYDSGTKRIYLNGSLDNETTSSQNGDNSGDLWFGAAKGITEFAPARIDDIRIYDRALTASQIEEVINGTPLVFTKAERPVPADGTVGVNMPLLQWTQGEGALLHDVYIGQAAELTAADQVAAHQPMAMVYLIQGLQPGVTYYWRVDEIDAAGTVQTGDVWSFVAQALTAYYPSPADGAVDTAPAPVLTWMPGQTATKHHLYFGDSAEAVTQGTADIDQGELTDPTFTPGALDTLTTYYWRVDESVAMGPVRTGPVWKFTTCLPVDDFESYTDSAGSAVFDTWIDGLTNGLSGSVVGNATAPFAEQQIVHGGKQSMPLDYNNVQPPFYSETEREFAPAQDWTTNGLDALIVYVRGRIGNTAAPLYVALEDASQHVAFVAYPEPAVTSATRWKQWKIPLSDFAGVNLAKVKKLYLGVGDRQNPAQGGAGRVYLDDLCLAKP
jgi:hypothetical protein